MISGIGEKILGSNRSIKVRSVPRSTIHDLHNYYMKPLLKKKPCKVILHIGTNDATISGASSDSIIDALLHLKSDIKHELPTCEVIMSTPVERMDNQATRKIIDSFNTKLVYLNLCCIDNSNIDDRDITRRGLHLNN